MHRVQPCIVVRQPKLIYILAGLCNYAWSVYILISLGQNVSQRMMSRMHSLSQSLSGAESIVPAPPSAAARIDRSTFGSLVHDSWNRQTASVIESVLSFDAMTLPEKAKKAWNGKQS